MNRIRVAFFGSSTDEYQADIQILFECLFSVFDEVVIINGGYRGTMETVPITGKELSLQFNKSVFVQGLLFDGYKDDPVSSDTNNPNTISDVQISFSSLGSRVQSMIELADIVIALPGKTGTLHEILQEIETIRYGMDYSKVEDNFKCFLIHENWKTSIDNLFVNGNMSGEVHDYLINNCLSIGNEKGLLENKLKDIKEILNQRGKGEKEKDKEEDKVPHYSVKIYSKPTEELNDNHKIVEIIKEINHTIYGKYHNEPKNKVVGLDIALKETNEESSELFRLDSVGSKKYLCTLTNFLSRYKSVISSNKFHTRINKWYGIDNINTDNIEDIFYQDKNRNQIEGCEETGIETWVDSLKNEKLGKSFYWTSVSHDYYHISAFLLLDVFLPINLKNDIEKIVNQFLLEYMLVESAESYIKKIKHQALRASISQVMARNTSHNIGAHVMNKLIGDLRDIDLFKNLSIKGKYQSSTLNELYKNGNNNNDIIFDQIAIFNNYVKCRMDYLADIALGTPLMQTNKYVFQDLFKDIDKVRLLLEYISGLSGFNYKIEFKRRNNGDLTESNDLLVAIPNDILGQQAFYNILENIIRNTAKHGNSSHDKIFTVEFIDESEDNIQKEILKDYIAVEIYDNVNVEWKDSKEKDVAIEKENKIKRTNEEKKEDEPCYNKCTGKEIDEKIDYLVYCQNRTINDDILKDNNLRHHSLGMIEMDASAAYLRKEDVVLTNSDDYNIKHNDNSWQSEKKNPHFIKAVKKQDGKNNYLGYRFFLLRPALALVVTDDTEYNETELNKNGIRVVKPDKFKTDLENGTVYSHEFVLYEENKQDTSVTDTIKLNTTSLPVRILEVEQDKIKEFFKKMKLEEIEEFLWKIWNEKTLVLKYEDDYPDYPQKSNKKSYIHNHDTNYTRDTEKYFYHDALSSAAQRKLPKFNNDLSNYTTTLWNDETTRTKLGESIISRIIVIDERIQENSNGNYVSIPLKELYLDTGIIVPMYTGNEGINLSANSLIDKKDKIQQWITKYVDGLNNIEKLNKGTDFILIHYGILERMFQSDHNEIERYLKELGEKCNVVITSGRGEPDGLPKEVRFLNLSSVIYAFVNIRSKYFANYILHLSRKSSKFKK
jgi:predicted Rossmann-fold nucleotide-binding protein